MFFQIVIRFGMGTPPPISFALLSYGNLLTKQPNGAFVLTLFECILYKNPILAILFVVDGTTLWIFLIFKSSKLFDG